MTVAVMPSLAPLPPPQLAQPILRDGKWQPAGATQARYLNASLSGVSAFVLLIVGFRLGRRLAVKIIGSGKPT
jgi:hypothetical protein